MNVMLFREKLSNKGNGAAHATSAEQAQVSSDAAASTNSAQAPAASPSIVSQAPPALAADLSLDAAAADAAMNSAYGSPLPPLLLAVLSFGAGVLLTSVVRCVMDRREQLAKQQRRLEPIFA